VVNISPQQEIWTAIRMLSVNLGYTTYDHIDPNANKSFPYVFVGEQFEQRAVDNKEVIVGTTQVTLHFIHNSPKQRGTLTEMMSEVEKALWRMKATEHFNLTLLNTDKNVLMDDFPIMHGTLEVEYKYYRRNI